MLFNKRFLQWTAGALLFLFPAVLFSATFQIGGTGTRRAIDTLTVTDNGSLLASALAANTGRVIFETDSLAPAGATRARIIREGLFQLDCRFFRLQALGTDRVQLNATGGRSIITLKLNGVDIPTVGTDSSKAGQTFHRDDAGENAPLPACGPVPSLTFYGLVILALILSAAAYWIFRKRMVTPV